MNGHKGLEVDGVDRVGELRSRKWEVQEQRSESYCRTLSCIKHACIMTGMFAYFISWYLHSLSCMLGSKRSNDFLKVTQLIRRVRIFTQLLILELGPSYPFAVRCQFEMTSIENVICSHQAFNSQKIHILFCLNWDIEAERNMPRNTPYQVL